MSTAHRTPRSLDGLWQLRRADDDAIRTVVVPGSWTLQIPGAGDTHESVQYEREVEVTAPDGGRRVILRFGAVNHTGVVRLNGEIVGRTADAWLPYEFDITDHVRSGTNILTVDVSYPPRYGTDDERGFLEHPLGKQSWYGTNAGIWQSVTLEERDRAHIRDVTVLADADSGNVRVEGRIADADGIHLTAVASRDGSVVATAAIDLDGDHFSGVLTVPDPALWDLDDRALYDVTVEVTRDSEIVDAVTRTTGFRTFRTADGRFLLNGREIYLRAVLDQDYHPGSALAPDDFDEWERLLLQTRALGFNMLRVHIKRPHPRYYEIADRIGMLVWTELPSWMTWTPETAAEGVDLLRRLIAEDAHHPSIVAWTIMNESWGIDLADAAQRTWLRETFDEISGSVGSAVVVDNSACEPNFHLRTDIDDFHVYRGIPEARRVWDAKIAEYAGRPEWTFSPHGDAERTGSEPLVLSEFGNWGLPHALDQYVDGQEPWWFALGAGWAFGAADGTGLQERFRAQGLADVFGRWEDLIAQLHHAQLTANRYQTTSIRLKDEISGYVLTQLSDVQWEANGLFDMNRRPKAGTAEFALANGEHAVALRPDEYSAVCGRGIRAVVTTLPGPGGLPAGATLRVTVAGHAAFEVPAGAGREQHDVEVTMPEAAGQYVLAAELVVEGVTIARDSADIVVVDDTPVLQTARAGDDAVSAWLTDLGVEVTDAADLLVVRRFTPEAQAHARDGGRVLLLAEDTGAFGDGFGFLPSARLGSRAGDGDWVPRTEWLDRRGAFAAVPGDTVLGIAFEDLLGELVISGIPGPLRPAVVRSGIFSGWLRGTATSTATVRWSRGAVTVTTLRVRTAQTAVSRAVGRAMLAEASGAIVR